MLALVLALTIAAGLASRAYAIFPAALNNYPGDALWAVVVFTSVALVRPRIAAFRLAAVSLAIAFGVEALQLFHAPWLDAIRATTAGHLVLGNGFDWLDLLAYTVGILLAFAVDHAFVHRKPHHGRATDQHH